MDIIRDSTKITDIVKLEEFHTEFMTYEKRFEALREALFGQNQFHLLNYFVPNIGANPNVETYLTTLYRNEHSIEMLYDMLFTLSRQKLEYITLFNILYPEESRLRAKIHKAIIRDNHLEQIKELVIYVTTVKRCSISMVMR